MAVILGIETSCDETAAALLFDGQVVADLTTRQIIHEQYGGVVPELASRAHERLLAPAVNGVLRNANLLTSDIDGIAVTHGPGLAGALLVGVAFAKGMASALDKPLIGINHLEGHLWSVELTQGALPLPFLALVISGGHTLLVKVTGFGQYEYIGSTRDDAVGELLDKVGRMLGISFPAGADIDKIALEFGGISVNFPRAKLSDDPCGFSFSGIKTAVLYYLKQRYPLMKRYVARDSTKHEKGEFGVHPDRSGCETSNISRQHPEQSGCTPNSIFQGNVKTVFQAKEEFEIPDKEHASVAAGLMTAIGDMLTRGLENALDRDLYKALVIGGGVSASCYLRARFEELAQKHGLPLFIPPIEHCTDNGAMVAYVGNRHYINNDYSQLDLAVEPALNLFSPRGA